MRHKVWIAGLALILGTQGIWAETQPTEPSADQAQTAQVAIQTKTQAEARLRRPGNPLLEAAASDGKGCYSSNAAASTEALRRNASADLELRDTLVFCLQGLLCGDSCASLMILNLADPTNPQFVSRLRFHDGAERANRIRLHGDFVYLTVSAPDANTLFYAIDVSNPSVPLVAGSYLLQAYAHGIDIAGGLAFVVDGTSNTSSSINKLQVLDVTDPANIDSVGGVPTEYGLEAVRVRNNRAYGVGYYDVYTFDVANPSSPTTMSQLPTGFWPYAVALGEDDSLLYIADRDTWSPAYWSAFTVVNVRDPQQPEILCQFPLFGAVIDVVVQGHWAYVSHGSCGLQVFDISNPAAPDSVTRFEVPRFAGRLAIEDTILLIPDVGPFVVDPEGNACYPPTPGPGDPQEGDLLILSIADPTNPRLLGFYSPTPDDPTPVEDVKPDLLPSTFALYPNYPNPFNPGTMIEFDLPTRSEVQLTVYDLLGQQVAQVIENKPVGHHTMGLDLKGQASGVYFYELRAGDCSGTGKMLLLK